MQSKHWPFSRILHQTLTAKKAAFLATRQLSKPRRSRRRQYSRLQLSSNSYRAPKIKITFKFSYNSTEVVIWTPSCMLWSKSKTLKCSIRLKKITHRLIWRRHRHQLQCRQWTRQISWIMRLRCFGQGHHKVVKLLESTGKNCSKLY